MQNYKIASIPQNYIEQITLLENKIRQETGKEVAIVAYEPEKSVK